MIPQNSSQIQAHKLASPFRIVGDLQLVELHDTGEKSQEGFIPEEFDLLAQLSVSIYGEPPESARLLNSMVMDWVDEHRTDIENLCFPQVRQYLSSEYPEVDLSELGESSQGIVWEDQVDYLCGLDEKTGKLLFDVELVLDFEE